MIGNTQSSISPWDISYESLKSYLYIIAIKYSTEIPNDFDYSVPDAFKTLIFESVSFIKQDSNDNNPYGLRLLTEFHRLFLNISTILEDRDREELLQLFVNQQSQVCPSQRFINSIEDQIDFTDPSKIKITLSHALNYYLKIIEKYQKIVNKELSLHYQSTENTDLDESFASSQLIHKRIIKEILVNSLIGFFGKRDDNPFLCLNGTIVRLIYAKLDLETPFLFEIAIRDIVEKETSNTINLIENHNNNIHLPALFYYLLYSDNSLISKIDQFFKINIPAVELRHALEFIKEFPERLNSSILQNIENIYDNIFNLYAISTSQQDQSGDKYAIALKFIDSLNLNLGIEKDDEKIKIQDFLDEMSDGYGIYLDPNRKKQTIELIKAKYSDLLARKSREFAMTPSIIDTNLINYFREFPCDLFYEDSSVLDSNKINNLIDLIDPESTDNVSKKIALIILSKITSGYKMSFKRGDIAISSPKLFLCLYFDTFLEKFQRKYQVNFIPYIESLKDLDFDREAIENIIKFNQIKESKFTKSREEIKFYNNLLLPLFQLGIAKVNSTNIDKNRSESLNLIISNWELNIEKKNCKTTISLLIKFGQEDLINVFFDHGFFNEFSEKDFNEFLKIAIENKNNEALLKILNLIKDKIPKKFDINPWAKIVKPSIEKNFIQGIEAIESLCLKDELQIFLNRYSFAAAHYALTENKPEVLKTILMILKRNGKDPKDTMQLFFNNEISDDVCDFFSYALITKKDKLFRVLIENYPSEKLIDLITQPKYYASDCSLNLLELSCYFDSEGVFKILFEELKKNDVNLKNIIEKELKINNLDLNLFLYALQKENGIIFKHLISNYPKDKLNEFLELCLKKSITRKKEYELNILEYACTNQKEKMLKMLLELLQENKFNLQKIIGEPKNEHSRSILLIALVKKDNDAIFKILLEKCSSDLLIDFLKKITKFNISRDPIKYNMIEFCSIYKRYILISIFNKIITERPANFLEMIKENLEKSEIVKKSFDEDPVLMIFPFITAIKIDDNDFLLDFIYKYPTNKILVFLKQTIKSNIAGSQRDLDLIEYCCYCNREDILHLFFRKISLFQTSKLAEIYYELFEQNKNVKDFLSSNTFTLSCFIQEIIVSKNNELLSKFFSEYPNEKLAELLLQTFDYPHDKIFHKIGNNLLTLACTYNNDEAARILLDKCPEDKLKDFFDHRLNDKFSLNAFSIALAFGSVKLIKVLIEKRPKCYKEIELLEIETIHTLEKITENKISALGIALGEKNFVLAEFLINKYHELTDRDPEKLLKYLKKINNFKETILYCFRDGYSKINNLIEYSNSQTDQELKYQEIVFLKLDEEKRKKFIGEKLTDYLQKILDKVPREKIDEFINHQNINNLTALHYYLKNDDYEPLELSIKLILNGAIINYPSANTTSEDKSRNMETEEDFPKKKYLERVYAILRKISDLEISQEKITNHITFSNLLFLKAIADSKELSDEQKLAAINKLIEETKQDKSLADLILEEHEIKSHGIGIEFSRISQARDDSPELSEFELNHKSASGSAESNEKINHKSNLKMSSAIRGLNKLSQTNLDQEKSIKISNLLNPDEKEKRQFITKALLIELAKKIQESQNSHYLDKKRNDTRLTLTTSQRVKKTIEEGPADDSETESPSASFYPKAKEALTGDQPSLNHKSAK
ncbi:hypothetical protein LBMAG18_11370 [Alphaproteobacteria bacterium]|nr:hypothetical protein LBMAG18_11370 [Alphaproteobacteria bacterium]